MTTHKKKSFIDKLWGESSLLSKVRTIITISVSGFVLFGYFTGCFDGCRMKFEDNPKNKQQDNSILQHQMDLDSLKRFHARQRNKNAQFDSLFNELGMIRDNGELKAVKKVKVINE